MPHGMLLVPCANRPCPCAHVGVKGGGSLGGAPFGTHLWDPAYDCCQGYQEYLKFITNLIKIVLRKTFPEN